MNVWPGQPHAQGESMGIKENSVDFVTILTTPQIAEAFRNLGRRGADRLRADRRRRGVRHAERGRGQPVLKRSRTSRCSGCMPDAPATASRPTARGMPSICTSGTKTHRCVTLGRRAIKLTDVSAAERSLTKILAAFRRWVPAWPSRTEPSRSHRTQHQPTDSRGPTCGKRAASEVPEMCGGT
jgi:hypothetical protein